MSHFTYDDVIAASEDIGGGYRRSSIALQSGDTAISALSSKWHFGGPGTVDYLIHPAGWIVTPSETVYKHYV